MKRFFWILLISALWTNIAADERYEQAKAREQNSCSGLSQTFRTPITELKGDWWEKLEPIEKTVLTSMAQNRNAAAISKKAQIIGSAMGCGVQAKEDIAKLLAVAETIYPKGSAESKKFIQVIECTAARYETQMLKPSQITPDCDRAKGQFEAIIRRGEIPWMQ